MTEDVKEDDLLVFEDNLWQKYIEALPYGSALDVTERQYADDYAILAIHCVILRYHLSGTEYIGT